MGDRCRVEALRPDAVAAGGASGDTAGCAAGGEAGAASAGAAGAVGTAGAAGATGAELAFDDAPAWRDYICSSRFIAPVSTQVQAIASEMLRSVVQIPWNIYQAAGIQACGMTDLMKLVVDRRSYN